MTNRTRDIVGLLSFLAFSACVPIANWLIENVGTVCVPAGPCLVPVGFGLVAPSGVLVIGLALVLRDIVQRYLGLGWAIAAILVGGVASFATASPSLVVASTTAFVLSEALDLAVFTPLQKRGLVIAVAISSVVGLVVDGAVFLYLAFGDLDFLFGQSVGKGLVVFASLPVVHWLRRMDAAGFST